MDKYKELLRGQMSKVVFICTCGMVLSTYRTLTVTDVGSSLSFVVALLLLWVSVFHVIPALESN